MTTDRKVITCGICGGLHRNDVGCHYCGSYAVVTNKGIRYYIDRNTNRVIGKFSVLRGRIDRVSRLVGVQ